MRKNLLIIRSRCKIAKHMINSGCCGRKTKRDFDSKLLVFEFFRNSRKGLAYSKIIGNWSLRKTYSFEIKYSGRRSYIGRICKFTSLNSHVVDPNSRPSDRSCSSSEGCSRRGPGGGKVGRGFKL
jgi:hypothetical protein